MDETDEDIEMIHSFISLLMRVYSQSAVAGVMLSILANTEMSRQEWLDCMDRAWTAMHEENS